MLHMHADITLKAWDVNGKELQKVGIGQPFTLEVAIDGATKEKPTIAGLEHLYVRDNGIMSITVNGKSTTKYSYKVRIDTPSFYKIGPATVNINNVPMTSNIITVEVTDQPIAPSQTDPKKNADSQIAFLRFNTDKKRAVVGEQIKCALRFYYTDAVVNVLPISLTHGTGFNFDEATHSKGFEQVNGIDYNYFEFVWNAYPVDAGALVLPAHAIDFFVRSANAYHSPIAMFFGHGAHEQKRIYSNAISVTIDSLPAHDGPIHAIGSFTHFNARIEPSVAKQGEAAVLTLELEGEGVFDKKNSIELQGVPEALKYYDSKNYKVDPKDARDKTKYYFEFIIQGLQAGEWEIDRQSFTFFDTKNRTYKTLHTMPLSLMIMAQANSQKQISSTSEPKEEQILIFSESLEDIRSISRIRPIVIGAGFKELPWWLFFILVFIPLGVACIDALKKSLGTSYGFMFGVWKKRSAFDMSRASVKRAIERKNGEAIYDIFISLFAIRCDIDAAKVDLEYMNSKLKNAGMDDVEIAQWQQFFAQLTEYKFFNKKMSDSQIRALQEYAYHWINRLEKLL